ncbi:DUF2339 domain-containing protein [Mucilaginibacter sp. L3T2-6]|uniref:DUF2339 domain-containing protein n=1 Tax=Mucilaginibacter sp. L3T2-6 TaxID=3062491 RepID=UPI0026773317|nr:DUF2339 domain-containing protein [Mucilaginibacter sp. L3T2-6]MDO3643577.1 DUF2339 domain-containing protein [Mucilaginibacter sp. L3T2-6]MDV6216028.1 DUF2339 domain-containing protein [Mucilaginibacter sp. L3T2-6]
MDVLNAILLIVILIVIVSHRSALREKLEVLEYKLIEIQNLLAKTQHENKMAEKKQPEQPTVAVRQPEPVKPPEPPKPVPVALPTPPVEIKPQPVVERQPEVISDSLSSIRKRVLVPPPAPQIVKKAPSFFERYPDLEKFIGENLVNKIGIAILVLAIGFFVKYAIDNNWIGSVGRVGIGIVCGGILIGFAHRLRNSYRAFSSVLVGGGLAVFYFTITLAFQDFHLFTQIVALAILIVITVFAVVLALLYDKQELAIIALVGGFGSPFMVSNGSNNYNGLFIYLLVLNAGLLIIALYKAWRILNITSFGLSVLVFATVLYALNTSTYVIGLRFATIFYLLFFVINIINNIRENKRFLAADFTILLVNTALYFATGLYLLTEMGLPQYRGLFSASLAVINLVLSYVLFRNRKVDPNVLYLLIGITLTFISLTAPIQLHGNYITLFWASETVLLYWLYQKSGIKLMKLTSVVLWFAMLVSLVMDLFQIYSDTSIPLTIIANKGFITTIIAAVSSYLMYILVMRDNDAGIYGIIISSRVYRITALVLLFISGLLELNHQVSHYYPSASLNMVYLSLYVSVFVCLLNAISARLNNIKYNGSAGIILTAITIAIYLCCNGIWFDVLRQMLVANTPNVSHFIVHWLSAVVIGMLIYNFISACQEKLEESAKPLISCVIAVGIMIFLSIEFCLLSELLFYSKSNNIEKIQTVYIKTALPVLWGLLSFAFMWVGMRLKYKTLRIISLTLFSVTLLKLFLFDIVDIPIAGKIAAFFCLGVLLLIISFMYQKVKKILVEDETASKKDE